MKTLLSLFLFVVLVFSTTACNRTLHDYSSEQSQLPIEEYKEDIKNPVISIPTENLTEVRNTNLWLNQDNLKNLSLDGKAYKLPEELLGKLSFSHVTLNYPLLVYNHRNVYNLEEKKIIFTLEDIILSLEKEWGKTMGVNKVNPYGSFMELEPGFFNFIDQASLSPSSKKVAFSVHLYFATVFSSITGVFDIESSKVTFIEGPFMGQVQEIVWSPDEKNFAYILNRAFEDEICLINSSDLKKVISITSIELLEGELTEEQQEHYYLITKIYGWSDNSSLIVQVEYRGIDDSVKKEFTKIISY